MQISGVLAAAFLLFTACDEPTPLRGESTKELDDLDLDTLNAPVRGDIAGEEFEAVDAYFRAFREEGRERVDLVFAEVTQDDCGLPLAREGLRVWLRFDGVTELENGAVEVDRDPGGVSVHYERRVEGLWVGIGVGVARAHFDTIARSHVDGRVHICFDDGAESCVAGAFTARACLSRLDGYLPREGTGVSDPPRQEEAAR